MTSGCKLKYLKQAVARVDAESPNWTYGISRAADRLPKPAQLAYHRAIGTYMGDETNPDGLVRLLAFVEAVRGLTPRSPSREYVTKPLNTTSTITK